MRFRLSRPYVASVSNSSAIHVLFVSHVCKGIVIGMEALRLDLK